MSQQLDYQTPGTDGGAGAIEVLQRNPRLAIGVGAAAIILGALLAYMPAIRGDFIWDDDYYVTRNPLLSSLSGLQRIWFDILPSPAKYPLPQYYPMTYTTFWIESRLWGANPTGYHLTNVLLHSANALLIWMLLRKLAVPGAWAAAAIFAVHPMNVESVAWIAERKNVLCGFFFFASLYVYLRYAGVIAGPEKADEYFCLPKERERIWGLAFALFFFALTSKTISSTLPAVVLLIIWWKRARITWDDVWPLAPFFALGVAGGALTGWMEVHRVGASGPEWELSFVERFLVAGRALWFYAGQLLVPFPLMFNYPRWQISVSSPIQWIYPLAAMGVVVLLWINRGWLGRGPLAGVLYYVGTLVPALGFFNVYPMRYSFVADHFAYLSCIGLIALATAVMAWVCARYLPREAITGGAPQALAATVLAIFFFLSLVHANVFRDSRTLWENSWRNNRKSWFAANNYGVWVRDESRQPDRLDKAEQWFHKVIELDPTHYDAPFNLGVIAERRGHPEVAERYYRRAIELFPRHGRAHYQLGQMYLAQNRIPDAVVEFRRAIELDPNRADLARNALGYLLARQAKQLQADGRLDEADTKHSEAIDQYVAALEINPAFIAARNNLGSALVDTGRIDEAVAEWSTALDQDPRNADILNNLGRLFVMMNRLNEAGMLFERAVKVNPNSLEARTNLGTAAAMTGRTALARQEFEAALKIDPDYRLARQKLADLESGKLGPASTQSATAPARD